MNNSLFGQIKGPASTTITPSYSNLAQRKCACGDKAGLDGKCAGCRSQRLSGPNRLPIQPKLRIGRSNDKYEQEADRVADQVMRMPDPRVARKPTCPFAKDLSGGDEEAGTLQTKPLAAQITPLVQRQAVNEELEEEEPIQTKPLKGQIAPLVQRQPVDEEEEDELAQTKPMGDRMFAGSETPIQPKGAYAQPPQISPAVAANIHALQGGGRPLPEATRALFEPRFSADFSQVRVHTDSRAAETSSAIQAKAFTIGQNIAFGAGQYAPHSHEGRRLLAHELTHVVQQNGRGNLRKVPLNFLYSQSNTSNVQLRGETTQSSEEAKQAMLDALARYNALAFLRRLRGLDEADRNILERDANFLTALRRHLRGLALWIVRLTLRFGSVGNHPSYVRQLMHAVSGRRAQDIQNLLRTYSQLRNESEIPGVREMLTYEFRGTRHLTQISTLYDTDTLNRASYNSAEYASAVSRWPNDRPVWPQLTSRRARENFVRYIVHFDLTNCRPYGTSSRRQSASCRGFSRARETFTNLCQGYATQMHVRYHNAPTRLGRGDIGRLRSIARIYENQTAAKFRMPIFIATVPGHAFNAILVGSSTTDVNSYLFLEPQNDTLFNAGSSTFQRHFRVGILGLSRLTAYGGRGAYQQTPTADFVRGARGVPTHQRLTPSQRVALSGLMRDLFVTGDWNAWKHSVARQSTLTRADHMRRIQTDASYCRRLTALFEAYMRGRAQLYRDEILAFVGRFVIGREFTWYPGGPAEILTQATYIRLMNKPALRRLMR